MRNNVTQVKFVGAHSDVGGGYEMADDGLLSDIPLQWMHGNLTERGILFQDNFNEGLKPNINAMSHCPWKFGMFRALPKVDRDLSRADLIEHPSVSQRDPDAPVEESKKEAESSD